ncbi:hypothetical protein LguiB_019225 [Lonicera macranthoides]
MFVQFNTPAPHFHYHPSSSSTITQCKMPHSSSNLTTTIQMPLSPLLTTALLLLFSGHLQPSSSQSLTFSNCTNTFTCGTLTNITYPFTGGDRPSHCGPPDFHLTCLNNATHLTAGSLTYRVLQINQTLQTLTLVRLDLYNNTCPSQFLNSTLNPSIFTSEYGNDDLTLIYGCNTTEMRIRPHNLFNCDVRGVNFSDAYYLVGPVPSDPILSIIKCHTSVALRVLLEVGNRLTGNRTTLGEALMEGFMVNYSDPYSRQCENCSGFGGQCGFDSNSGQSICICDNNRVCVPPANNGSNNGSTDEQPSRSGSMNDSKIVLPVLGAILAGIGIGWLFFCCRQRRKRLAAQAQTVSKGLPTPPPSSKDLTSTPSAKFTRSIPSYPSSKSELGKASTYFGVQVFTYAELEEATDNFDTSRELGDGGFGTVYYGKLIDGREVAVKRLYENNFKREEQFINEVEILARLNHQYLVKLYGCTSKRSRELLLVYEYIPNGTVADHLHGNRAKSGLLSWPVRLNIAIETAEALAFLHQSDIIHRDVKTNNILLDNSFCVKVADFGLSRLFPNDTTHVSTAPQGTPGYVDPEYYQCYQLTTKSDVYSFGVVLVELISSLQAVDTNRHRHNINLANMAINKIQNRMLNELVDPSLGFESNSSVRRMATLVAELAFQCLQQEKDLRPSMKEVLDTLRGIGNEELNAQKAVVMDIAVDDGVLKKGGNASQPVPNGVLSKDGNESPHSPDSVVSAKWVSGSTLDSSG